MAITTSACLNLPPPPPLPSAPTSPLPSSTTNFTHQLPCRQLKNEQKWKSQCLAGMACMIIGLEFINFAAEENPAMASQNISVSESKERSNGRRWSEKRSCPSWRLNSLETIVPENLPRPSARRRWELVRRSENIPAAVELTVKNFNDCFTT